MFAGLRKLFGASERKSLSHPTEEEFALFSGGTLPGGFGVSAAEALRVPAVHAAVETIANACATLDIRIVRMEGDAPEDDNEHPVAKLLHGDVNDWTSGFDLIGDLVTQALTSDAGGLAWVNRVDGKPVEIIHYLPGQITVTYDPATGEPSYSLASRPLRAADVIHLRSRFDRCPLSLAREAIGIARVMESRVGKMFKNAARPGGWIKFPEHLDEDAFERMKKSWDEAHGSPENSGKTAILFSGGEFHPLEFKSTDAQFLELRKFQILEIARAFNLPPQMLGDMERATWSNAEQKGKEFLSYTLEPWLMALEATLSRALFSEDERPTYRVLFDRDDLTRASLTELSTAISTLISARVINPNKGRAWLNLKPYTGGEQYLNPNITVSTRTTGPAAPKDEQ